MGVLAAAGLVALDDFEDGVLRRDHFIAQDLALFLSTLPGLAVDLHSVETNIIRVEVLDHEEEDAPSILCLMLKEKNVLVSPQAGSHAIRVVIHRDIELAHTQAIKEAFHQVCSTLWRHSDRTSSSSSSLSMTSQADEGENQDTKRRTINVRQDDEKEATVLQLRSKQVKSEKYEEEEEDSQDLLLSVVEEEEDFEEEEYALAEVAAMSVSSRGFLVIFKASISSSSSAVSSRVEEGKEDRYLAVEVTPNSDPMSDGTITP